MTQYILQLVLAEMNRIRALPPAEYRREYRELNERVRGMYGRADSTDAPFKRTVSPVDDSDYEGAILARECMS